MEGLYQTLVWSTPWESVPFEQVYPDPRPRYEFLYEKLIWAKDYHENTVS